MSAYLSPMVFEEGDRILSRGSWWVLSGIKQYPDGGTSALTTLTYDDDPDNPIARRVDFDMSVLYLTERSEPVQLDLFTQASS